MGRSQRTWGGVREWGGARKLGAEAENWAPCHAGTGVSCQGVFLAGGSRLCPSGRGQSPLCPASPGAGSAPNSGTTAPLPGPNGKPGPGPSCDKRSLPALSLSPALGHALFFQLSPS